MFPSNQVSIQRFCTIISTLVFPKLIGLLWMGKYEMRNHADFHYEYLREVFRSKNTTYSKKSPHDAKEKHYFDELRKRVREEPEDLKTFQFFLEFCNKVRNSMI